MDKKIASVRERAREYQKKYYRIMRRDPVKYEKYQAYQRVYYLKNNEWLAKKRKSARVWAAFIASFTCRKVGGGNKLWHRVSTWFRKGKYND